MSLRKKAAKWEAANLTASHAAYREWLETVRGLLCDIEFTMHQDANRSADWLRTRNPRNGKRLRWIERFTFGLRYRARGKLAAEPVLEAAKDVVRMAEVHREYLLMENGTGTANRYRTED